MGKPVTKQQARKLIGKNIYAVRKDGGIVTGKLVMIKGNQLVLQHKSKKVRTTAIIPLVLFDLLAIGTHSGYGPYGPYGPYGGYGVGPYGGGYGPGGIGGIGGIAPFF